MLLLVRCSDQGELAHRRGVVGISFAGLVIRLRRPPTIARELSDKSKSKREKQRKNGQFNLKSNYEKAKKKKKTIKMNWKYNFATVENSIVKAYRQTDRTLNSKVTNWPCPNDRIVKRREKFFFCVQLVNFQ